MQRRSGLWRNGGSTVLNLVIILGVVVLVALVLFPVVAPHGQPSRKTDCMSNLKGLAGSLQMYCGDYDELLPSSVLHQEPRSRKWDAKTSAEFCSERGPVPPPKNLTPRDLHWVQLLWPHMRTKDLIWCPSDPDRADGNEQRDSAAMVSYIYRPALDRAWFGGDGCPLARRLDYDTYRSRKVFRFAADQVVFFEKKGWHWGDGSKGWRDGVSLNAAFLDGHVRIVRLKDAVNCDTPGTAAELADVTSRGGEPLWFNWDGRRSLDKSYNGERRVLFDVRRCYDSLP